jgi:flagellar motor protein MotB
MDTGTIITRSRGVAANRIYAQGCGAREPVGDNTALAGRAVNGRVEIYVTEARHLVLDPSMAGDR